MNPETASLEDMLVVLGEPKVHETLTDEERAIATGALTVLHATSEGGALANSPALARHSLAIAKEQAWELVQTAERFVSPLDYSLEKASLEGRLLPLDAQIVSLYFFEKEQVFAELRTGQAPDLPHHGLPEKDKTLRGFVSGIKEIDSTSLQERTDPVENWIRYLARREEEGAVAGVMNVFIPVIERGNFYGRHYRSKDDAAEEYRNYMTATGRYFVATQNVLGALGFTPDNVANGVVREISIADEASGYTFRGFEIGIDPENELHQEAAEHSPGVTKIAMSILDEGLSFALY